MSEDRRTPGVREFAARTIEREGFRYTHTIKVPGRPRIDHYAHAADMRPGVIVHDEATGGMVVGREEPASRH